MFMASREEMNKTKAGHLSPPLTSATMKSGQRLLIIRNLWPEGKK